MDNYENVKVWSIVGFISGMASLLNQYGQPDSPSFSWPHIFMRGIVGLCVGTTFAWIINIKLGNEYAVPAASIGAWFSSETMVILERWIQKRLKNK